MWNLILLTEHLGFCTKTINNIHSRKKTKRTLKTNSDINLHEKQVMLMTVKLIIFICIKN